MGDRLATIDMGQNVGGCSAPVTFGGTGEGRNCSAQALSGMTRHSLHYFTGIEISIVVCNRGVRPMVLNG